METFLIKEHKEQGHTYTSECPECYAEAKEINDYKRWKDQVQDAGLLAHNTGIYE